MSLVVETRFLQLRFEGSGRLLPWLGPALRGAVARRVKDRVCRWAVEDRNGRWKYCHGCPHQQECPYGATFEPDPPPGWPLSRGMADGQRAIALTPHYPVQEAAGEGDLVPVRVTLLGRRAVEAGNSVVAVMTDPKARLLLGSDRVVATLQAPVPEPGWPAGRWTLSPSDFPASPETVVGRIPWLRLDLTSPLFLKESSQPGRASQSIGAPQFGQLLRASLRVVGRAFATFGDESLEDRVDFAALKKAAEDVATQTAYWTTFRQRHHSNRRRQQYDLVGVVGGAVFADVPLCLLPWLIWGGRLGVGEHRVAGAGCWRVVLA